MEIGDAVRRLKDIARYYSPASGERGSHVAEAAHVVIAELDRLKAENAKLTEICKAGREHFGGAWLPSGVKPEFGTWTAKVKDVL